MSFKIECLKEKDVEESAKAILQYLQVIGGKLPPPFQDSKTIGRMIFGPHAITLIARKEEKIAGIISGFLVQQTVGEITSPQARIELMITDAESAKERLDSMLVSRFLQQVKDQFPNVSAVDTVMPVPIPDVYFSNGFAFAGLMKGVFQGREAFSLILRKTLSRSATPVT
ncbi:hypothetical protein MUP05_09755 [Candidatus Bathyarchaeota archaeon]|nr:hypothetical protein [Candidatus Bathyarchaeota archaeon]